MQSLKSRGIRFPGRDNESLAPIFTPPRSGTAPEADVSLEHLMQHNVRSFSPVAPSRSATTSGSDVSLANLMHHEVHVKNLTSQQTEEAFDVARNSFELLSTVLSSSTQKDVVKVYSLFVFVAAMFKDHAILVPLGCVSSKLL